MGGDCMGGGEGKTYICVVSLSVETIREDDACGMGFEKRTYVFKCVVVESGK